MIRHAYPCFICHLSTINHQNGYFAFPVFLFHGKSSFTKSKLSLYRQWRLSSMLGTLLDPFPLFFHFFTFCQNERLYLHLEKGNDTTLLRAHRLTLTCILTKVSQMCTSLMNPVATLMHRSYKRVCWLCWLRWRRSTKASRKIEPFSCCWEKARNKKKKWLFYNRHSLLGMLVLRVFSLPTSNFHLVGSCRYQQQEKKITKWKQRITVAPGSENVLNVGDRRNKEHRDVIFILRL